MLINGPGPGQNYGEMAVNGRFYALPKSGKRAENPFFSKITPEIGQKTDTYLGKGYFFLCTTLPGRGLNIVRIKKWVFFFGPKNSDFGPKIHFFIWKPVFSHCNLGSPGRYANFETNGSSLRLFVPELRPFS